MRGFSQILNATIRRAMNARPPRGLWPGIPEPRANTNALYNSVAALKQGYEQLVRSRGDSRHSAVLLGELDEFAEALASVAVVWTEAPARPTSPGEPGQIAKKGEYLYVCVARDRWLRTELTEW